MVKVIATITSRPDSADAVKRALTTLAAATRKESGCVTYELFQGEDAPHEFVTVEEWHTGAAVDAHMGTPHVAAAIGVAGPLLGAPLQVKRYVTVA